MRVRVLLAALVLAAGTAACRLAPPGRCGGNDECLAGQECAGGLCVAFQTDHQVGSRCLRSQDCVSWGECSAAGVCVLRAGRCAASASCQPWEECPASTHVCTLAVGRCADAWTCQPWEECPAATHVCTHAQGKCQYPPDCLQTQRCDVGTHACVELSPVTQSDVLVVGDFGLFASQAWAPLREPTQGRWSINGFSTGFIDPAGDLVYTGSRIGIRRFVFDPLTWVTGIGYQSWDLPGHGVDNDPVLVTTSARCPTLDSRFVMQPSTGALLVNCSVDPAAPRWTDEAGAVLSGFHDVIAWAPDGHLLARVPAAYTTDSDLHLVVVDPAGTVTTVTGFPSVLAQIPVVRVVPEGFRIAVGVTRGYAGRFQERWLVSWRGVATQDGVYADPPSGIAATDPEALGSDGAMYGRGTDASGTVIVRRPLAPGTSTVVYRVQTLASAMNAWFPWTHYVGLSSLVAAP